jgi:hypothetical protein
MPDHDWPDDARRATDAFEVRHVQPYQAVKVYRCPGCDLEIRVGEGHEVVVPRTGTERHRHWHTGCWTRTVTRGHRPH